VRNSPLRALLLLLTLSMTACGFHLRGTVEIPPEWLALHLTSPSPHSELSNTVKSSFSANGVEWMEPAEANYTLHLGPEKLERRNLSIDRNARAAEFELKLSTSLSVTDSQGAEILPAEDITVHKIMTHDPENVTGKVEEERLLRREMRTELVQRMLRKIRFLATAPPATASTTENTSG
jgi:LPS-assembly lipoprotein